MKIVSPSILSADFLNFQKEIESFKNEKNLWFHLDVMDGHYVPNLTFGKTILKDLHKITNHKLDAHFMVTNPEDYIEQFKDIGIYNFSFHWETCDDHLAMIKRIKEHYPSVGLVLHPSTDCKDIPLEVIKEVNLILVMSVNPGFGGQSFMTNSLDKIKYFDEIRKKENLNFVIQVDGGINEQTAKDVINAGVDNLVAGSFIFKSDNYSDAIKKLR
ncbi:MAG: ribulose-phosphate 3-epimerase [Bacteriovoracaceae bacterium]|jgi:ribulose-phosphate 3-epimerase|nr:ribulose-phosphate 3-epimerase [Bacteriovoracaceae bacterium]